MSKRELIFAAAGVAVGGAIGFAIGYKALKKKVEKESKEKLDREVQQLSKSLENIQKNYEDLTKDDDTVETEDDIPAETYNDYFSIVKEEDVEVEPNEDDICEEIEIKQDPPMKHKKPRVMKKPKQDGTDPIEDDPGFYKEDVYYYMNNELLLDSDGNILNEADTIGNDLRRFGFLQGQGTADEVMVRNYDMETDYIVHRRSCSPEDDFDFMEEQDE